MPKLSQELLDRLLAGRVSRREIISTLGIERGVAGMLKAEARRLQPGFVVERRKKARKLQVDFHLRPAKGAENPGRLIDLADG
jgi:hypothetical protein